MRHVTPLVLLVALLLPMSASASGLGKFVQGSSDNKVKKCRVPPPPDAPIARTRFALMGGVTDPFNDGIFSLYGDAGYRLWHGTSGCSTRSGMFASSNWWWHSFSIGVSGDFTFADPAQSKVGPMLSLDNLKRSKGFLSELDPILAFGAGMAATPYYSPSGPGVSAAVFLRAIFSYRFGLDIGFDGTVSPSFHIGIIDPHLMVWEILSD